ncbi:MAG: single-stranded-DNA-specific exonuclease RecJ [Lachnospiraceae bacterium]|nr:single-stranded-DNA-specific exonuclease RecJ [Lachnospiraceae bacterium]
MSKWMVAAKKADFDAISRKYHISPVLARIIRNRDVVADQDIDRFLNGTREHLYAPGLLKDMDKAVDILLEKIAQGKHIRIIGDYDIDGICSTYILYRGLTECGADADTSIPHRIRDGYGLNENLIQEAYDAGTDTVVTCDNGIAAYEQIAFANSLGMTVIVTDHHEVPYDEKDGVRQYRVPEARAVVDPKQEDCGYPFPEICGAVVAYKLVLALLARKEGRDWREVMESEIGLELLELAAFATIGDVMELKEENRIIVKSGIELMKDTRNAGLKALMQATETDPMHLKPYTIGFVLGPCLNATGRLDTAVNALELFKAADTESAAVLAGDLKAMNDSRKELTRKGVEEAIKQIEDSGLDRDKVLVVYLPEVHESLAGIIAGRIREKYCKPVFVLTRAEDGVKGSGRSIEAFHMYDEMTKCKELFTKYGGHKLAAGLSLQEANVDAFRRRLNENCALTDADFEEKVLIDVPMPMEYASIDFVREISRLEPFGNGNPKPQFAQKNIRFVSGRVLGANHNVGKYTVADERGRKYEMIYFGDIEAFDAYVADKYGTEAVDALYHKGIQMHGKDIILSVVYYPDINEYRGSVSLQMVMKYYQ